MAYNNCILQCLLLLTGSELKFHRHHNVNKRAAQTTYNKVFLFADPIMRACFCKQQNNTNISKEDISLMGKEKSEKIVRELSVDKSNLSRTIRKSKSAPDDRTSAKGIGYVGVIVLVVVIATIVGLDLTDFAEASCRPKGQTSRQKNQG
jgi:hypothetical protein